MTAGCSLLRDVFLRGRSYRQFFDRGFLEIGLGRGAARFQGARVPVAASDRGCFSATLSCLVLAYHLPLSSETGVPELRGKTKNKKKKGQGAPKHQSIFASAISMFYFLKIQKY